MTRLAPIDRTELDDETAAALHHVETEGLGWLPTSLLVMARRPELARAFVEMSRAVSSGPLDPELQTMMTYVSSYTRECAYCQAHTACKLSMNAPEFAEDKLQAAPNFEEDDRFTDRERAALRLARDASKVPNAVTDDHFAALREYFTETEILDLVASCAFFGYLNCFNDTMATTLEEVPQEFAESVLSPVGWAAGKHG